MQGIPLRRGRVFIGGVGVAGVLSLAVSAPLACACGEHASAAKRTLQPSDRDVSAQQLDRATADATAYLVRAHLNDGSFVYCVQSDPTRAAEPGYNILRHCGTIYALGMAHEAGASTDLEPQIIAAIDGAQRYLLDHCTGPVPGQSGMLAVWSDPELNGERIRNAKLGGAGLGLIALLVQAGDESSPATREQVQQLGRFLLFMQEGDGSFTSHYVAHSDGRGAKNDTFESLYYPGEAALGLIMLYEADRDSAWVQGAADAIAHLARSRQDETLIPHDHWALLATARLLPLLEECPSPPDRALLIEHAVAICEAILNQKEQLRSPYHCMTGDGRTTPTATRLEGLLAALAFLPEDRSELRERIWREATDSMRFLLDAQINDGLYAGAFPKITNQRTVGDEQAQRILPTAGEIRIDYVQHALSAMIQYRAQLRDRAGGARPGAALE